MNYNPVKIGRANVMGTEFGVWRQRGKPGVDAREWYYCVLPVGWEHVESKRYCCSPSVGDAWLAEGYSARTPWYQDAEAMADQEENRDPRVDGYNPEFLGAKPPKAGEDY